MVIIRLMRIPEGLIHESRIPILLFPNFQFVISQRAHGGRVCPYLTTLYDLLPAMLSSFILKFFEE